MFGFFFSAIVILFPIKDILFSFLCLKMLSLMPCFYPGLVSLKSSRDPLIHAEDVFLMIRILHFIQIRLLVIGVWT